jgi:hypothetical protein
VILDTSVFRFCMLSLLVSSRARYVMFACGEAYLEGLRTVARTWKPDNCQYVRMYVYGS